jgi:hypothetical protein
MFRKYFTDTSQIVMRFHVSFILLLCKQRTVCDLEILRLMFSVVYPGESGASFACEQ